MIDKSPIDMLGTASWTSDEAYAKEYDVKGRGKRIIFVSKTQRNGISIMPYSDTPYEYEVITSKNALYQITSMTEKGESIYVYLEEQLGS